MRQNFLLQMYTLGNEVSAFSFIECDIELPAVKPFVNFNLPAQNYFIH